MRVRSCDSSYGLDMTSWRVEYEQVEDGLRIREVQPDRSHPRRPLPIEVATCWLEVRDRRGVTLSSHPLMDPFTSAASSHDVEVWPVAAGVEHAIVHDCDGGVEIALVSRSADRRVREHDRCRLPVQKR